nr:hypothetical protein [Tanacetum cinerariifolium]
LLLSNNQTHGGEGDRGGDGEMERVVVDVVRLWIWGGAAGSLAGKVVAPEMFSGDGRGDDGGKGGVEMVVMGCGLWWWFVVEMMMLGCSWWCSVDGDDDVGGGSDVGRWVGRSLTGKLVAPKTFINESVCARHEELNTIPEKEFDEFIKSSVEDIVPITSESEDTSGSDSQSLHASRPSRLCTQAQSVDDMPFQVRSAIIDDGTGSSKSEKERFKEFANNSSVVGREPFRFNPFRQVVDGYEYIFVPS